MYTKSGSEFCAKDAFVIEFDARNFLGCFKTMYILKLILLPESEKAKGKEPLKTFGDWN